MINKSTVACCEQISDLICKKCCEIDGVEPSKVNIFQVSLLLNTWAYLGEDLGWIDWATSIQGLVGTRGLVGTIKMCKSVFYAIIDGEAGTCPEGCSEMFADAKAFVSLWKVTTVAQALSIENGMQALSLLFRFPLRFTYQTDAMTTKAFEKFLEANRDCYCSDDNRRHTPERVSGPYDPTDPNSRPIIKGYEPILDVYGHKTGASRPVYDRTHHLNADPFEMEGGRVRRPGYSLISKIRSYIEEMIGTHPIADFSCYQGGFSSGANSREVGLRKFRGKFTLARKIEELYEYDNRFDHMDYGYFITLPSYSKSRTKDYYLLREFIGSAMIAVPKSLTDRRLIKPESVNRSFYAMRVRRMLEAQILSTDHYQFINWSDQSVNKNLARLGSEGKGFSTIDASAASDRISRELAFMLVPEWVRPYLYNAISDYVIVGDRRVRVRCLSTSGCQITWLTLAIIMWSIAEYGCSWYTDDEGSPMHAYAYGDDLVVPDCAYETVVDLLETFGFKINRDKSYSKESDFRESCGGDYVLGVDITPVYWRRGIVNIDDYPGTMDFICTLQHKLYNFRKCRSYLERVARQLDPRITYSSVSTECSDLWDGNLEYAESEMREHRKLISHKSSEYTMSQTVMDHQYFKFLRDGRMYANDSDRFFDISMSYLDPSIFTEPTMRWVTVRPPYLLDKE